MCVMCRVSDHWVGLSIVQMYRQGLYWPKVHKILEKKNKASQRSEVVMDARRYKFGRVVLVIFDFVIDIFALLVKDVFLAQAVQRVWF